MLSNDQLKAKEDIISWLADPDQPYMLLMGWAGTGKSTMMKDIVDNFNHIQMVIKNENDAYELKTISLSATTNKAAGALSFSTGGRLVETIHSLLKLRVVTDKNTNKTSLEQKEPVSFVNQLVVIDEAWCMNNELLEILLSTDLINSKILFIGDPTQLLPVGDVSPIMDDNDWPTATLTEVLRQDKNSPIQAFCKDLREFILGNTYDFPLVDLDGISEIQWLDQREFNKKIIKEFSRPDWRDNDSKVLAYTNKAVVAINKFISGKVTGLLELDVGDLAINNNYVKIDKLHIGTDEIVQITGMRDGEFKVFNKVFKGRWIRVNNTLEEFFLPNNIKDKEVAIERALKTFLIYEINNKWIDLRAAFACTVNKSQGSTYKTVFIDLTDIGICRSQNQLARLIYVAISRAKSQVYFTGDIG